MEVVCREMYNGKMISKGFKLKANATDLTKQ